jgi:hypothetical protein
MIRKPDCVTVKERLGVVESNIVAAGCPGAAGFLHEWRFFLCYVCGRKIRCDIMAI